MGSTIARILFLILIPVSLSAQSVTSNFMLAGGPTGGAPTTVVDTISADVRDAYSTGSSGFVENLQEGANGQIYIGDYIAPDDSAQAGFLFTATIPQGKTVDSAFVMLYFNNVDSSSGSLVVNIYAYDADNIADFAEAHTHMLRSHGAFTSGSVAWTLVNAWSFEYQRSPNLAAIAQTVVSRAGFASGYKIGFVIVPSTTWAIFNNALIYDYSKSTTPERRASVKFVYH